MARNRKVNRENVKKEKRLDLRNSFDIVDPTPRDAVIEIIKGGRLNGYSDKKRTAI